MHKPKLATHVYQPDGLADRRGGVEGCQHCTMPKAHPVHAVPPVPADAAHLDARRLGESEDR